MATQMLGELPPAAHRATLGPGQSNPRTGSKSQEALLWPKLCSALLIKTTSAYNYVRSGAALNARLQRLELLHFHL